MRPVHSLTYRPALDGLRALAVIGVFVFHLDSSWLRGGWLGVDVFFVLSGFLITTLLITEYGRTGTVNLIRFWKARMRRLLPALVTVLISVLVLSFIWAEVGRRSTIAKDVVASLFYVVNWRFVRGDEQYFDTIGLPSPVRHLWSLSIEEQFYVGFPLVLLIVTAVLRNRHAIATTLAVIAAASAFLMSSIHTPGMDVSDIYFRTDTRIFELLIGACAAIWTSRFAWKTFPQRPWILESLGWLGLGIVIVAMATLNDQDAVVFRGGLVVVCLATVAMVVAAVSLTPTHFSRLFSKAPLRHIGLISYPLYLWHWPIIIFGLPRLQDHPRWLSTLLVVTVAWVLSWATYRFVELPIRVRHLVRLVPGRPRAGGIIALSGVAGVLALALALSNVTMPGPSVKPGEDGAVLVPPVYRSSGTSSALLLGNSIPASLISHLPPRRTDGFSLHATTHLGCDPFEGTRYVADNLATITESCADWRESWTNEVTRLRPDIVLYFVPQTLVGPWQLDGERVDAGDPRHDDFVLASLESTRRRALAAGAENFAVSTLACHDMISFGNDDAANTNDINRVRHLRELTLNWAGANDVHVIDSFEALCSGGYRSHVNGVALYDDGLHFTEQSAPIIWDWMRPQLEAIAENNAS